MHIGPELIFLKTFHTYNSYKQAHTDAFYNAYWARIVIFKNLSHLHILQINTHPTTITMHIEPELVFSKTFHTYKSYKQAHTDAFYNAHWARLIIWIIRIFLLDFYLRNMFAYLQNSYKILNNLIQPITLI